MKCKDSFRHKILPVMLTAGLFLLTAISSASGQESTANNPYKGMPVKERLFFGGDFGLSFGDVTYVRVAPLIGYHVSPKFQFGGGPSYQYWNYRALTPTGVSEVTTHIYGVNTFARFFPIEMGFIQSDFEMLNLRSNFRQPGNFFEEDQLRVFVPVWLVGAGYVQRAGRSGFMFGIFYDLIQDRNSPYGRDIIIRAGAFF